MARLAHRRGSPRFCRRGGGGAPAFNPLDPLLSIREMWLPLTGDASDDGTTLTIPSHVPGGTAITATGVGRPTIAATGLDGFAPAIDNTTASVTMSAALDLAGMSEGTVYILASGTTTVSGYLWREGAGANETLFSLYNNGASYQTQFLRLTNAGSPQRDTVLPNNGFCHPRVAVFRWNRARTTGENAPTLCNGLVGTDTLVNDTNSTGAPGSAGPFILGSQGSGLNPAKLNFGGAAVFTREHTDAEVAQMTAYLQGLVGLRSAKNFLWVGDSNTANSVANSAPWRKGVYDLTVANGDRWYFTVGLTGAANVTWVHDRCRAGGGATIPITRTAMNAAFYANHVPDVVPIMIGTNDIGVSGDSNATIATNYGLLLDDMHAAWPNALKIAQKILPRTDSAPAGAQVTDWNANYHDAMVAAAVSRGIRVISDDTLATLGGLTYLDGLHPDAASGPAMSAAMYARAQAWAAIA